MSKKPERVVSRRTKVGPASAGLIVFAVFFVIILLAGGGSRADILGQAIVRPAAAFALALALILGLKHDLAAVKTPLILLAAMILAVAAQISPLPHAVWSRLPDRDVAAAADAILGFGPMMRPLSLSPSMTENALFSLTVPIAAMLMFATLPAAERRDALPTLLLAGVVASALLSLLQLSGAWFDHPLLNDLAGVPSGVFANRNHQALLLACGLPLAAGWATKQPRINIRRYALAAAAALLFILIILGLGSRAGLALAGLGSAAAALIVWRDAPRNTIKMPPRVKLIATLLVVGIIAGVITASIIADRASSIRRAAIEDVGQDMRSRAFPVTWQLAERHVLAGGGAGSFDPLFRRAEPDRLLKPTYFNHAHNDFIEIVIEFGLAGLVLLAVSLAWFILAGSIAWRSTLETGRMARVATAVIAIVILGSLVDYPARTPIVMVMLAVMSGWLAANLRDVRRAQRVIPVADRTGV